MSVITKDNWVMYCVHANEMPHVCPCGEDCGCQKWGACRKDRKRVTANTELNIPSLEQRVRALENKLDMLIEMYRLKNIV